MMSATTILYIMAAPYSGSTLLTMLLATHPAIGTLGERGHYDRKMTREPLIGSPTCSCGAPFRACPFWTGVQARVMSANPLAARRVPFAELQLGRRLPRPLRRHMNRHLFHHARQDTLSRVPGPLRRRYTALLDANAALIRAVLAESGTTLFLDASKVAEHAVHLSRLPDFNVRVLHLVRDGRAQVASALRHHPDRSAAAAAAAWRRQVEHQTAAVRQTNLPCHQLRYEDLCADPRAAVNAALAFAGVDGAAATLDVAASPLHIMGNPMRLRPLTTIADPQRWRDQLAPAQLDAFERAAGSLNRALGYAT